MFHHPRPPRIWAAHAALLVQRLLEFKWLTKKKVASRSSMDNAKSPRMCNGFWANLFSDIITDKKKDNNNNNKTPKLGLWRAERAGQGFGMSMAAHTIYQRGHVLGMQWIRLINESPTNRFSSLPCDSCSFIWHKLRTDDWILSNSSLLFVFSWWFFSLYNVFFKELVMVWVLD